MSPSKGRSNSKSGKTKRYVLLKQPTLLKDKSLGKQGKEISTTRSPSEWVAMYAMALYSKKYKQLSSAFLYRKGTVYRYSITFKSKSGRKCATARLTSRSACKVTPGPIGKSRSCHAHGSDLAAKKKSLSKSKLALKKASKSLSATKKRVAKAKKALAKTKAGTSKRATAKKKVKKASKATSSAKKTVSNLKAEVKKKSKEVKRCRKSA